MKYPKYMLYVIVVLAFAALLYTIYTYNKVLEGFSDEGFGLLQLAEKFQALPDDQKEIVCKTLREQIIQVQTQTNSADDSKRVIDGINEQMAKIGCTA